MASDLNARNFLNLRAGPGSDKRGRFHVIPAPLEATVTYGTGTGAGPDAILAASAQVELFDGQSVPAKAGIHTTAPAFARGSAVRPALTAVRRAVASVLQAGRIPVVLGGEHTVTLGAVAALRRDTRLDVGFVQLDAHADLRRRYEGKRVSHACVARRVVEQGLPVVQVGIRSRCPEEERARREFGVVTYFAADLMRSGLPPLLLPPDFPECVYVTVDVDVMDASLMPATGTPEPGGLFWYETLGVLERIARERRVCGFDVVELAPIPGLHAPDYTAAKLVYAFLGMIRRAELTRKEEKRSVSSAEARN